MLDATDACIDLIVDSGTRLIGRRVGTLARPGCCADAGVRYTPTTPVARALARRELIFSPDVQSEERDEAPPRSVPSAVARLTVPLVAGDEPVGVLFIHWTRAHQPTPIDLDLAEALGHHAAAAIHTAQLHGGIETARRVAHDLNNALTLLSGYGELLPGLVPSGDATEIAHEMARAATEAAALILRLQHIFLFEEPG